jgi:hypothetical protein
MDIGVHLAAVVAAQCDVEEWLLARRPVLGGDRLGGLAKEAVDLFPAGLRPKSAKDASVYWQLARIVTRIAGRRETESSA